MPALTRRLILLFRYLRAVAADSYIEFLNTVGVGGGGINRISKTGITTVTDAGAAGIPIITYIPTTGAEVLQLGSATQRVISIQQPERPGSSPQA